MGWGRMLLLGDTGQQLDIADLERSVVEMQSSFLENQDVDLTQARNIAALQKENRDLKLYLATLVRLLMSKGVVQPEEVQAIVRAMEPEK